MKKEDLKTANTKVAAKTQTASSTRYSSSDFLEIGFLISYMLVHFITDMKSIDVIGPHWFYIAVVDLGILLYLSFWKTSTNLSYTVVKNPIFLAFLGFVLCASISYTYAINPNETIVCFARIATTLIAFYNIAHLANGKSHLFHIISYSFIAVVTWESYGVLSKFFADINSGSITQIILTTTGNTGNKNILAASIAIKIPFTLYLITRQNWGHKISASIALFLSLFALFILNARSSFVAILLIILLYIIFYIIIYRKNELLTSQVRTLTPIILILFAAFGTSVMVFDNVKTIGGADIVYDNPLKRVSEIKVTTESSSGRLDWWGYAFSHLKKHPFGGAGYGNWKLASIEYEKETSNDFTVAYHAHNDFLEFGAELGFPGLLLYIAIYICVFFLAARYVFNKEKLIEKKEIIIISSLCMVSYGVDAFFNFPSERTVMQINLAFALGLPFIVFSDSMETKSIVFGSLSKKIGNLSRALFIALACFCVYVNYQVFDGMKGQRLYYPDVDKGISQINSFEYDFPTYPQLSYNTMPIKAVMARYKMKDKKYEEAIKLLDEASKENPYLHFSDFLKAGLYFEWGKPDSGYKYAGITFENKPRSFSAYKNWLYATSLRSDTNAIQNAFETYTKYRNEPVAWKEYALAMLQAKKRSDDNLIHTIDSAIVLFPDSTDMLRRLRADLERYKPAPVNGAQVQQQAAAFTPEQVAEATMHNNNATRLFNEKKFEQAAKEYLAAAAIDTRNFALYENAGVCYYSLNNFPLAIKNFDMAINVGSVAALKSYFFKGVAQVNTGNKEAGCASMNFAIQKGFQGDQGYFNSVCK